MGEFKGTKKPWRTSKDFREVTTSKIGILEGSKKICTMASYCNHSVRLWNDFNEQQGKEEMLDKIDMLILELDSFKREIQSRT